MKTKKEKKESHFDNSTMIKPARILPGIIIVILQWLIRFVLPAVAPDTLMLAVFGGILGGFALIIWWLFFSRAPKTERWLAIPVIIVILVITSLLLDKSIATANVGLMFPIFSIPVASLAFIVWVVTCNKLPQRMRMVTLLAFISVSSGFWTLLRTNGMDGELHHDFAWRWSATAEEKLLSTKETMNPLKAGSETTEAEWPGFRGKDGDGVSHGIAIETDWVKYKPEEIWRKPVGPGCSSFAVQGNVFYTQEQRGEYESVSCYSINDGAMIWSHRDSTRFWDSHAGAGPRSTPTLENGRVYTLGANGILNVLNAADGTLIWSRNAASDTKVQIPGWGYCASPLLVDSLVIVAISGQVLAYNKENGTLNWQGTDGGDSYSSPHLVTLNNEKQLLFMNKSGTFSYAPHDGRLLWSLPLIGEPIIQPNQVSMTDLLISPGSMKELRRISVKKESGKWEMNELWKSATLKPYFNDIVVHKGFIYGFEGPSLTCIDAETGIRKWKGGRYAGEIILLSQQGILLILSEKGELILVEAAPEAFRELSKIQAIKGKTWNHPVIVNDVVLVRNMEEMAAYRLTKKKY